MNRRELEKYEQIRNIASRDWLSASSVSLTKLDQVKTSVYNIGSHVTDARTLRPRARSAKVCRRKKSYTEMDTEPPLSKLSIQTHAWGSNTSIPDLIRQQSERLQSGNRPTSATVSRRPWSAKKIPQSPSSRKPTSIDKAIPFNEYGPPIAILGERYNPRSRPPSGSMSVQHHDVEAVTVANTHEDLNQMSKEHIENTLEEFVNSQPNANAHNLAKLSAAYADEETVSLPPPPPCGSPDIERMINGGTSNEETDDASKGKDTDREELRLDLNIGNDEKEESDDEDKDDDDDKENMSYKEINVKQSPRTLLLRRPTPEPMLFSIPTGEASDEDELDTDRLLKGGTGHDIEVESVDNYIYDDEPQNNDSKYTSIMLSSRSVDEATGTRPVTKATVRIAEDRNITVDITPRSPHSPRRKRMVSRRRPRSAVTSNETDVMAERQHAGVRTTHPAYRKRPVSAKARLATSTVSVDYGDADEKKEAIPDDDKAMENRKEGKT
uniref:Uncharacterized protein LOC102806210 n=1 Tax=Saccoglossus kowalevskii TaxID=10224 RepID=A0ABM0MFJ3_SACKO|nr:PREDICTED: uncharacterized protein LOC102806210 [Saccoglossus kowalevskii]